MGEALAEAEEAVAAACTGIVRRIVRLPHTVFGGVSRAIAHGSAPRMPLPHPPPPPPLHLPLPAAAATFSEAWGDQLDFLGSLERQCGTVHPVFYTCSFSEALKMAAEEGKLAFVYLHAPEHPFTASFCRETLCSDVVVQFLDANFVCWGALEGAADDLASMLRPPSFPFCAIVAPVLEDSIAVLQQMEGPVSPAELVEILQGTVEEQGLAFDSIGVKEAEERRKKQQEQEACLAAALKLEKDKEKPNRYPFAGTVQIPVEAPQNPRHIHVRRESSKCKSNQTTFSSSGEAQTKEKKIEDTQILVRFPNGERRELSFSGTDKIQSIYEYVDSLQLHGLGDYRLISSLPRRVFDVDQIGMNLLDAGLHPRASLFIELL